MGSTVVSVLIGDPRLACFYKFLFDKDIIYLVVTIFDEVMVLRFVGAS